MPVPVKQPAATSDLQRTFTDCLNPAKVAVFGNFSTFVNSVIRILRFISHLLLAGVEIQKILRTPALEPNCHNSNTPVSAHNPGFLTALRNPVLHCVEKNPPHNLIKSDTGFLGGCDKASVGRQAGICIDFKNPR